MAEKRKLMLISPMLHQGGFERVCVTTARLLEPYFEITVVIFDSADIAYDVEGLHIIDLQLGVQPGKVKKIWNILKRSSRVRKLKKQIKPDISYSFGPSANMVNAFSKTRGTKVWLGIRSYMDLDEHVKLKLFEKLADRVVCCAKEIEEKIKIKYRFNQTGVLYNPYDVDAMKKEAMAKEVKLPWQEMAAEGKDQIVFVSMGRDDEIKGFWHMLKSFALVEKQCPQARLMILGEGSFEKDKALAKALHISDKVYFAGMQTEPYKYLQQGDIYLLTSYHEGFPNALVEGMALGLAAVSTDCRSGPAEILLWQDHRQNARQDHQDDFRKDRQDSRQDLQQCPGQIADVVYGDYGILVPVMEKERNRNAEETEPEEEILANVMLQLIEDERLLKKYQQAAAERARIFTYEGYVEQFLKMAAE